MTDFVAQSSVKGELTIDHDPIEVVHERLYRKVQQNGRRQNVIATAFNYVQESTTLGPADKFKLSMILSQNCD
jgi:hypothetical protein